MVDIKFDADKIKQINDKIKEATKALSEADSLATELGYNGLVLTQWNHEDDLSEDESGELYDELEEKYDLIHVSDLENAIDNAGWSTSSSYC